MPTKTAAVTRSPEATDYFDVRSLLTEDERMIQDVVARFVDVVARFVDERVLPIITQAFDESRFPAELVPELAELGLLGCYLEGYDCAGLNAVSYGLICQELDRGDAGIRSFVSVQTSLCMY
ncbi:MAG: acyl-CoA dehydrogenase family protein, partial [Planctomycetota bacterium]